MVDLEQARIRGEDAKALLNNPILKQAFERVAAKLEENALRVDVTDKELALNVIRAKQLLASIKREIERVIEDGEFAKINIELLKKPNLLRRIVR